MNHLPRDLLWNILSRSPLKYLIRLSCVCKQWHSIVLDPKFAVYLFRATSLQHRLLISKSSKINSLDLETPSLDASSPLRNLDFPFKLPSRKIFLLGSCNGLVFVSLGNYHGDFYIWNPSTGYIKPLPDPGFKPQRMKSFRSGFGYVSATDDYKVFVASRFDGDDDKTEVKIFSLRANMWKELEGAPIFESLNLNRWRIMPALLHETLHWLQGDTSIIAFDLEKEVFREVPFPVFNESVILRQIRVFSKECLSISLKRGPDYGNNYIEFWVMKEYDVRESWTVLFKYNQTFWERSSYPSAAEVFMFFTESGRIAQVQSAASEGEGVRFSCLKSAMFCGSQSVFHWHDDVIEYAESLISLDGF